MRPLSSWLPGAKHPKGKAFSSMLEPPIRDNIWPARRDPFDNNTVVHGGVTSRREDLVSKLLVIESALVPRVYTNSTFIIGIKLLLIQAKIVQENVPQLPIVGTSAKVAGDASIKFLGNADEKVMGGVVRIKFSQLFVDGLPVALKSFTFPKM